MCKGKNVHTSQNGNRTEDLKIVGMDPSELYYNALSFLKPYSNWICPWVELWTVQWRVGVACAWSMRLFWGRPLSLNVIDNFLLLFMWLLGKSFVPFEDICQYTCLGFSLFVQCCPLKYIINFNPKCHIKSKFRKLNFHHVSFMF